MFKNKTAGGKNNICGKQIYTLRKNAVPKMSQRMLAEKLQIIGVDVDKNAIQRMESGQRFITDIELYAIASVLNADISELYGSSPLDKNTR